MDTNQYKTEMNNSRDIGSTNKVKYSYDEGMFNTNYTAEFDKKENFFLPDNQNNDQQNIYDYLIQFKEKYNVLQMKLNELNRFKLEIDVKNKRIADLENQNASLKEDIKKNNKKVEENFRMNMQWETQVKEIKAKMIKLEEEKMAFKDETERWKSKVEDLEFQLGIFQDKEKIHQDNLSSLKKFQNDYEQSIDNLRKEYKDKEDNLKRKNEALNTAVMSKLKEQEREFQNGTYEQNFTIKNLEKELDRAFEENNSNLNKIYLLNIAIKEKESDYSEDMKDKDRIISELELKLKNLSNEANNHINRLNNSIDEINNRINEFKEKEQLYQKEITDLESYLQDSLKKNQENEEIIERLKSDNNVLNKSQMNVSIISEKDEIRKERDNNNAYIKKLEDELNVKCFNLETKHDC
jgi:chromosome segregation ATPase